MTVAEELDIIMFSVADRFKWDYLLIESMPISKLWKWYNGAARLYKLESNISGE